MMAFMLVIKCAMPATALVVKPQANWGDCVEQRKLVETFEYPNTKCEAKCVGRRVFQEVWREREHERFGQ